MFARKFACLSLFVVCLPLMALSTGCAEIILTVQAAKEMKHAHEAKENRKANTAGIPRQWVKAANKVRKSGEKLGKYWEDGWIGDRSKPFYDAYEQLYATPSKAVQIMNALNDRNLVTKDELEKLDLYTPANALRFLVQKYKAMAGDECVQAANEAQTAANNGIIQDGEPVAAMAYRRLVDLLDRLPDVPQTSTLHYQRIMGVSGQNQ